jgi:hypothetical protein
VRQDLFHLVSGGKTFLVSADLDRKGDEIVRVTFGEAPSIDLRTFNYELVMRLRRLRVAKAAGNQPPVLEEGPPGISSGVDR